MRSRLLLTLSIIAGCGLITWKLHAAGNALIPSLQMLHVVVGEPADTDASRVLADVHVQVQPGKPLKSVSGGETSRHSLPLGTRITGLIETAGDARSRVALEIDLASAVANPDADTEIVRHDTVTLRTILRCGQTRRLDCGGGRWCDLTLADEPASTP